MPRMRIGIVSDLHGNLRGLDAALAHMGEVGEVWCAGDAFNEYRFSNEVVARLREIGARYVLGNHEEVLLGPGGVRARERADVDARLLAWVGAQPRFIEDRFGALRILMFHSTPWAPYGDYLYPHSPELARLADLDADVAIYGHTHAPLAREVGGTLVINPGSAGLGQGPGDGRPLSYAVFDTETREVELRQLS
jgi:putative phosphoesterase